MTDMPERIWVSCNTPNAQKKSGAWHEHPYGVQYIHVDLHAAALAERDAEIKRLREALTWYATDAWGVRMPEPPTQEEIDTFGGNIINIGATEVLFDKGRRAREALEGAIK